MQYNSPPTTIPDQINILASRNMEIPDNTVAEDFLSKVSYYRFAGYALHFEEFTNRQRTHRYKLNTTFNMVTDLYDFDDRLRSILFDAITHIEVAFRTQLCLNMSLKTNDSHWQDNPNHFDSNFNHPKFLSEINREVNRSREIFIKNYTDKYTSPVNPASWMLIEIVSFGSWSRIYKSLIDQQVKKDIASFFNIKPFILESWIQAITVTRNLCAHHGRIWNASLTIKPTLTSSMNKHYNPIQKKRIVIILDIISELLKPLNEYNSFINRLNNLLYNYSNIPYQSMGLATNTINPQLGVRE